MQAEDVVDEWTEEDALYDYATNIRQNLFHIQTESRFGGECHTNVYYSSSVS